MYKQTPCKKSFMFTDKFKEVSYVGTFKELPGLYCLVLSQIFQLFSGIFPRNSTYVEKYHLGLKKVGSLIRSLLDPQEEKEPVSQMLS